MCTFIRIVGVYRNSSVSALKIKVALIKWSKRGRTVLLIPGSDPDPPLNITIYMDVSINPGPADDREQFRANGANGQGNLYVSVSTCNMSNSEFIYSRNQLLCLRTASQRRMDPWQLQILKQNNILKFWGKRAGKHKKATTGKYCLNTTCSHGQPTANNSNYITCLH